MKKIVFLACLISAVVWQINAQVGGLSASKLATLNTDYVPSRKIEFEPSCYFLRSANSWNENGGKTNKFQNSDSTEYFSSAGLRFTYGLLKHGEVGGFVPMDMSAVSLGAKINLLEKDDYGIAVVAGINLNKTSGLFPRNSANPDEANLYAGGLVGTYNFSEKFSLDADLQLQRSFDKKLSNYNDLFADADIGYFVVEGLQLVLGMNYNYSRVDDQTSQALIINPGFTNEWAKTFIAVLSFPVTVYGKNTDSFAGVTFALTILLE